MNSRIVYEPSAMKPYEGDVRIMGVFAYREWVDEEHDLFKMRISGPVFAAGEPGNGTRPCTVGITTRWYRGYELPADKKSVILQIMQSAIKRELCWRHCEGRYPREDYGPGHKSWTEKVAAVFIETTPTEVKSRLVVFTWKDVNEEQSGLPTILEAYVMGEDCQGPESTFCASDLSKVEKV